MTETEGETVEIKEYKVGDTVAGRFKIVDVVPPLGSYPHFLATDKDHNDHQVVLSQIGRPNKPEPDKVKRGLERATRSLSWIRHPGFLVPREFVLDDGILFSVFPAVKGHLLDTYIQEHKPTMHKMVHWIINLTEMLEQIHEARVPQFLGQLPMKNVLVNADGEILLLGFDLNQDLKLQFLSTDFEAPRAPESQLDPRSDVWAVGKLFLSMVDVLGDEGKKAYKEEADLRALIQTMTAEDPEKRVINMPTLRSRLERVGWKDAPKPPTGSVVEQPITVLTVEEEDKFKELRQKIVRGGMLLVLALLLVALVGQLMYPDGGEL